jgi:thioredoxin 1
MVRKKMRRKNWFGLVAVMALVTISVSSMGVEAQTGAAPDTNPPFAPLEQWKNAVLAGDAVALKGLYSADPPAEVLANKVNGTADADVSFWLGLKARSLEIQLVRVKSRSDAESIIFHAAVQTGLRNGQTVDVISAQAWRKQGEQWRLVSVERTDAPHLKQPADMKKDIYPASGDAHAEIKEAEARAAAVHKRLLLVFGANWCYDCHVLDLAFQRPDLAPVLAASYEVVHVDLGPDEKKNADLVKEYDIPLNKGIPALAVAESDGKLVVSQKGGEFENARALTPEALLEFLKQWKPETR